jgi:hypothetical protein
MGALSLTGALSGNSGNQTLPFFVSSYAVTDGAVVK